MRLIGLGEVSWDLIGFNRVLKTDGTEKFDVSSSLKLCPRFQCEVLLASII